ncbi:MAG: glycosyltransferase family 4 protein, partial [Candidatus Hydrogenedentes bacterium]|nr:glycosyltransferase family 4 protein [Candidatus Hydrogenedentota bacterium]
QHREIPVIFSPGRMEDPAKGMAVLLDAAAILADEGKKFEVHATLPEGHGGAPWLKAVGKIAHEDIPRAYQRADICVVPSVWDEPFGLVALEAMASGLPVCASRVGGLQDIVIHEETGLLFERGSAVSLATVLGKMLDSTALCHTLGEAGRSRVLKTYRWETILEQYYPSLFHE